MLGLPCTQLTSTLRSFRALALQLMRSTVTPENRVDVIQGVICLAYMVRSIHHFCSNVWHPLGLLDLAAPQSHGHGCPAMINNGMFRPSARAWPDACAWDGVMVATTVPS